MEKWKDIKGFEGQYKISNHGRVKSLSRIVKKQNALRIVPEIILRPGINECGYRYVILFNENKGKPFRVNRLVAKAFIRNPDNKPEVNHKDRDKLNDHYKNLEWSTKKENMSHYHKSKKTGRQLKFCFE